jgi:hypothetical protein
MFLTKIKIETNKLNMVHNEKTQKKNKKRIWCMIFMIPPPHSQPTPTTPGLSSTACKAQKLLKTGLNI